MERDSSGLYMLELGQFGIFGTRAVKDASTNPGIYIKTYIVFYLCYLSYTVLYGL